MVELPIRDISSKSKRNQLHVVVMPNQVCTVYDRYSIGIIIGQYIGFADMGNVLLVSADTDFHIGR